jgi:carbamoyl-phosphate synthase large subunit
MLAELGISCTVIEKNDVDTEGTGLEVIDQGLIDLVINVPRFCDQYGRPDGYLIRRRAVDAGIYLITDLQLARAVIEALRCRPSGSLQLVSWNEYQTRNNTPA